MAGIGFRIATAVAPFLFRYCPSLNLHTVWDKRCSCHQGEWDFVWHDKQWKVDGAPFHERVTSEGSFSYSGQLSTVELLWSGLKLGLIAALVMLGVFYFALQSVNPAVEKRRIERQSYQQQ